MTTLITGAAGFLGSHLTDRLLKAGHRVIGVDNLCTGSAQNIKHLESNKDYRFLELDATNPIPAELLGDVRLDWVMHFASPASPPKYLKLAVETLRVNSEGTYNLLELAKAHGASFFLASTSECYGDPEIHPQREDYWGNVNPIGPRSVYDEAKRYAEAITALYHRDFGVPIRHIRIFNTYGPRMDPDDGRVVTNFINQALRGHDLTIFGDGSQTRSFQYVDDLIEGIYRLMNVEYSGPVNLGNPEEYTVFDFAKLINDAMGGNHKIVFHPLPQDDPKRRRPDNSLAKKLLDWEPQVPVDEGIRRTIAYFTELHNRG